VDSLARQAFRRKSQSIANGGSQEHSSEGLAPSIGCGGGVVHLILVYDPVHFSEQFGARLSLVQQRSILTNKLGCHDGRLQTAAASASTVRYTQNQTPLIVQNDPSILVLRIPGSCKQNWFH
jgi:hypothetical protein